MPRYLIITVDKEQNQSVYIFYDREEKAIEALKDLLKDHHVVYYGSVRIDGC